MERLSGGKWIHYSSVFEGKYHRWVRAFISEDNNLVSSHEIRFFVGIVPDNLGEITYQVVEELADLLGKPNYPYWLQEIIDEQLPIVAIMLRGE